MLVGGGNNLKLKYVTKQEGEVVHVFTASSLGIGTGKSVYVISRFKDENGLYHGSLPLKQCTY